MGPRVRGDDERVVCSISVIASGEKQSIARHRHIEDGLLRRFASRNDDAVVPAKAGTHTSRPRALARWLTAFAPRNACGYGSPRARGRPGSETGLRDLAAHERASLAGRFARLKHQRAQGMPDAQCARSLACKIKKHTSIVTTVTPGSPGIPRAMVLTVSFVLLCPKNLAECANGRLSTNRPSLDLSPFVLKGCEPAGELGTDPVSSSTRTVA